MMIPRYSKRERPLEFRIARLLALLQYFEALYISLIMHSGSGWGLDWLKRSSSYDLITRISAFSIFLNIEIY